MSVCPQCSADLPDEARKCPCCGKGFLSTKLGVEQLAIRRALETARAIRREKRRRSEAKFIDWRDAAGGIIVGFFLLYAFYVWVRPEPSAPSAAASLVRRAEGEEELRRQISFTDREMTPVLDGVEVRGELTNSSGRALLHAEILTIFRDPDGNRAGTCTGEVKLVEPGQAREFVTAGKLRSATRKREGWSWRTELGRAVWAP
ncbi:MAG: zinc ribbon domain-containing protein [Candidatus Wallbacteria bacterium]|nr:zinc ribbon domain-containing protein [Candidatus Wallbacteria bacterium]